MKETVHTTHKIKRWYLFLEVVVILSFVVVIIFNYRYCVYSTNIGNIDTSNVVHLMTYNMNASSSILNDNDAETFLDIIKSKSPDLVCLQEVRYLSEKKFQHIMDSIYHQEGTTGQNIHQHSLLYSKFPIKNFHQLDTVKVYAADVDIKGKWTRVYSCHLTSNGYSTARRKTIKNGGSWLSGLFDYYKNTKVGVLKRQYEADVLRSSIDSASANRMPILVIGDLNDFSGSDCLNTIQGNNLEDAWWKSGNGFGFTYDAWNLKLRIDHVLYSKDAFEPVHSDVIDTNISDHKPLIVDLQIR